MSMTAPIAILRDDNDLKVAGDVKAPERFGPINQDLDEFTGVGMDSYRIALISPPSHALGNSMDHDPDSFVMLPMTWRQLLNRLQIGENRSDGKKNVARFGKVEIDFDSMEVRRSNRLLTLTALEFKVLKFFVQNPRRVISRADLLNQVWGYECYPCTRTVDNHVLRLRQKLEPDMSRPVHFLTVHKVGYKFVP